MTTLYDPAYGDFTTTILSYEEALAKVEPWQNDANGDYDKFVDTYCEEGGYICLLENDSEDQFILITDHSGEGVRGQRFTKFLVDMTGEHYVESENLYDLDELDQAVYNTLHNDLFA